MALTVPTHIPLSTTVAVPRMDRRLGVVAILVSATAMGFAGLFGRLASPTGAVIGEALTLGRMLFGAVGMVLVLAATGRLGWLRRTRLSWSVVLGGVFLGLSLATYLSATVLTTLSLAVVLHLLGPVLATVLARVVLGERLPRLGSLSLVASVAGMVLASGLLEPSSADVPDGHSMGVLLGALSGLLYGVALLCYRRRGDMPSDVRSFWNFVFGALGAGAMVAITRPDLSRMNAVHWAWAGAFFLVCGLLALGLLVVAGKHLRAVELSALSYWEVVVAVGVGAVVYGEALSGPALLGTGLVVAGAAVHVVVRPSGRAGGRPSRESTLA